MKYHVHSQIDHFAVYCFSHCEVAVFHIDIVVAAVVAAAVVVVAAAAAAAAAAVVVVVVVVVQYALDTFPVAAGDEASRIDDTVVVVVGVALVAIAVVTIRFVAMENSTSQE